MGDRPYGAMGRLDHRSDGGKGHHQAQSEGYPSSGSYSSYYGSMASSSGSSSNGGPTSSKGSTGKRWSSSETGHEYPNKRPMLSSGSGYPPTVYSPRQAPHPVYLPSSVHNKSSFSSNQGSEMPVEVAPSNHAPVHNPLVPLTSYSHSLQTPYTYSSTSQVQASGWSVNSARPVLKPGEYYDPLAPPTGTVQPKKPHAVRNSSVTDALSANAPRIQQPGPPALTSTAPLPFSPEHPVTKQQSPSTAPTNTQLNKTPSTVMFSFDKSKLAPPKSSLYPSKLSRIGVPRAPTSTPSTSGNSDNIAIFSPAPSMGPAPLIPELRIPSAASLPSAPPASTIPLQHTPRTSNSTSPHLPISSHSPRIEPSSELHGVLVPQHSNRPASPKPSSTHPLPPSYGIRTLDSYSIVQEISEGAYGVVYKAIDKESGEVVALKKVKIDPVKEKEAGFPVSAVREIRALAYLRNEHVVRFRDIVPDETNSTLYLALDYIENDLHQLIKHHRGTEPLFSGPNIKSLMFQLLTAIAFLHSKNYMHRDIKTSNLLLSNEGKLYLADFGLAKEWVEAGLRTPTVVTIAYRAPELVFQAPDYNIAIDIWSVGLVMAELLTGREFLRGVKTELDLISKLVEIFGSPSESNYGKGYSRLQIADPKSAIALKPQPDNKLKTHFPNLSRQGFDLLSKMLCYNPETRITASQALQHPWFKEYPLPMMPVLPRSSSSSIQPEGAAIKLEEPSPYLPPNSHAPYSQAASAQVPQRPTSAAIETPYDQSQQRWAHPPAEQPRYFESQRYPDTSYPYVPYSGPQRRYEPPAAFNGPDSKPNQAHSRTQDLPPQYHTHRPPQQPLPWTQPYDEDAASRSSQPYRPRSYRY